MNAPAPSRRPIASATDTPAPAPAPAPALVTVSLDTRIAANDDTTTEPLTGTEKTGPNGAVNPLWMITAALALFLGAMAILIAS